MQTIQSNIGKTNTMGQTLCSIRLGWPFRFADRGIHNHSMLVHVSRFNNIRSKRSILSPNSIVNEITIQHRLQERKRWPTEGCRVGNLTGSGKIWTDDRQVQNPRPYLLDHRQSCPSFQPTVYFRFRLNTVQRFRLKWHFIVREVRG